MSFTHKAELVTTNGNTYNSVDEFVAEHGPCGLNNPSAVSATADLNASKTGIIRTIVFNTEEEYESVFEANKDNTKNYTNTLISKG